MRLLLDTHIAFWIALKREKLSDAEMRALVDADHELLVSAVSLWELRLKWDRFHSSGERKGPADPFDVLNALNRLGIPPIALDPAVAATSLEQSIEHKDPFDELLLVLAQELDAKLMTRDDRLIGHPLAYSPL